jgi:hypothetical protein
MAKNEDIRPICGKNWGASADLLNVSYNSEFLTGKIEEELWKLNSISKIIKVEDKAINIIIPDMEKFTAVEFPQLYKSMFEPLESIPIFSKYNSEYNNMITATKNLEYINTQKQNKIKNKTN